MDHLLCLALRGTSQTLTQSEPSFTAPSLCPCCYNRMSGAAKVEEYGPQPGFLVPLPLVERGVSVVTAASPDGAFFLYCNGTNVIVRSLEVSIVGWAMGACWNR